MLLKSQIRILNYLEANKGQCKLTISPGCVNCFMMHWCSNHPYEGRLERVKALLRKEKVNRLKELVNEYKIQKR